MSMIKKIFHDFFYSFLPKVMKGSRMSDVYSSMRVMMVGCFTMAAILSGAGALFFFWNKQYGYTFSLIISWLICSVVLSILIKMRDKDRVDITNKIIEAGENIFTNKTNHE